MRRSLLIPAALATFIGSTATAHPHLFVGVDVTVVYNGDVPTAVRLTWHYDDFFSLILTSDLGIDADGDLKLSAEELNILAQSVGDWPADFNGDLEVKQGGQVLSLGARTQHSVSYSGGLVTETHTRPITSAVDPEAPLTIRAYDPFYYVAYELTGPVTIEGKSGCTANVTPPDLNAAYSLVDELLYGRPASEVGPDEYFPKVGAEFAETIVVTCE